MSWTSRRAARTKCRESCSFAGQGRGIAVVEQDQVDIARVVELAGAELAHADHREGGRLGIVANGELAVARELEKDRVGEGLKAARREGAELARHALEWPGAGDVGHGDGQRGAALEPAQARRDGVRQGSLSRRPSGLGEFGDEVGLQGVRAATPQIGHKKRAL